MSNLLKTKIAYMSDNSGPGGKQSVMDCVLNIDHISTVLPSIMPGHITVIMGNQQKYTIVESLESLFKKKKKKPKTK